MQRVRAHFRHSSSRTMEPDSRAKVKHFVACTRARVQCMRHVVDDA
jgi:hypothetical protein